MSSMSSPTGTMALRTLRWRGEEIVTQLSAPCKLPEQHMWQCQYRCIGAGGEVVRAFDGLDSMHALILTLVALGNYVDENFPGAEWEEMGHTGFPKWIPLMFLGTRHQREVEDLIESECLRRMQSNTP